MATILKDLPYFGEHTSVVAGAETLRVKPHQIMLWLSVTMAEQIEWDPRIPAFPALLDTGNNQNLSVTAAQLTRWAGIRPELLPVLGTMREREQRILRRHANLWVHANVPGSTARQKQKPFLLVVDGIAVYPDDQLRSPPLPLLGLKCITRNRLRMMLDGNRRRLSLYTRPRWWWLG